MCVLAITFQVTDLTLEHNEASWKDMYETYYLLISNHNN